MQKSFMSLGRPLPLQVNVGALGPAAKTVLQHRPAPLRHTGNAAQRMSMHSPA
jgi:hypothetical protein